MKSPSFHSLSGDLQEVAASAVLLAGLHTASDDDLRRLRMGIHKSPSPAVGFLDWLDHVLGWEQDRRAGYAYPLRGPTEAIRGDGLEKSVDALGLLAATFRGDAQISLLLNLVRIILPLGKPVQFHRRHDDEHQEAA